MATCKNYFGDEEIEEFEISVSSVQISENEESEEDMVQINLSDEDDEELRDLKCRLKQQVKIENPGEDYCFQNDPTWAPGEERPVPEPDPENRLTNKSWCICNNCTLMKKVVESVCCKEIEELQGIMESEVTCITEDSSFHSVCLDKKDLTRILTIVANYSKRKFDPSKTRCLRFAAYHSFTHWIYGLLGKHNRRPIPSCVVSKIRGRFPDPNGIYTGFEYFETFSKFPMDFEMNF